MNYFDLVLLLIILILSCILCISIREKKYDGELRITEKDGKEQFSFVISDKVLDSELKKTSLKFKIVDSREKHSQ